MPILVLSGRAGSADKVDALDAGADDYLTKPFSMDELLARLRALSRRAAPPDSPLEIAFGDVVVDLHDRRATRAGQDGEPIRLTPTEWALLDVLLGNPGRLVSQRKLLADVWGPEYHDETNYLRYYMNRLRKKLEPVPGRPRYLLTEPGMGYRFQP